jgi:hypothetical protein
VTGERESGCYLVPSSLHLQLRHHRNRRRRKVPVEVDGSCREVSIEEKGAEGRSDMFVYITKLPLFSVVAQNYPQFN